MGRFGSGSYRREKANKYTMGSKKGPKVRVYSSGIGPFTLITQKNEGTGKIELTYEGRSKFRKQLEAMKEKEAIAKKAQARRQRHSTLKVFFKKFPPIRMRTSDGKKVLISKVGFENLFHGQKASPRAFVFTLVDGKLLFFYRSSGESSSMPHAWLPTSGPSTQLNFGNSPEKYILGRLGKMKGHPFNYGRPLTANGPAEVKSHFPKWVDEISAKIKSSEKKLFLFPNWGYDAYMEMRGALGKIPITSEIAHED